MQRGLDLQVIGEVTLARDGVDIPMISSRKTRALLAYLAITDQEHPREHLCELFFDRTNDPRGALRWSLSRLRAMLGDDGDCLIAQADRVQLDMTDIRLDVAFVAQTADASNPTTSDLLRSALLLSRKPFTRINLPRADDFDIWVSHERDKLQTMRGSIIQRLAEAPDISEPIAINWLRHWVKVEPRSHDASFALWQRLKKADQLEEAEGVAAAYRAVANYAMGTWYQNDPPAIDVKISPLRDQKINFCDTSDDVRIAYASIGKGPPLVKAANWLNHLELDWQSPIWGETFANLSAANTLIRYDERGNGLSDWVVPDISFDAFVDDLETVVDHLGLDRFPLLGMSQGCAVSIAYAVRHPERVSSLVLIGGYAAGWRIGMTDAEREQREAVLTLTRHGWGTSNPAYRHIFSQTFMPGADADRLAWFDDFQRKTTSPENAVRFQEAFGDIDVRDLLAQVQVPTLVLHARGDQRIPLSHGEQLANEIPNARLVTLESRNHIILGDEPAWRVCIDEIELFLHEHAVR